MTTPTGRYTVLVHPEGEEGGYIAFVPALPGCEARGETRDEALANAREAIASRVSELRAAGQPVPADDGPWFAVVDVPV